MSISNGISVEEALALLAEFLGIQFKTRDRASEAPSGGEVVIHLGSVVGADVAVAGRPRGSAADLLKCLPSMAIKYLAAHRQIQRQQSNLDDYAAYVSQHLEELTWLRSMAQHLELCSVGQRLEDVAGRFLPALQEMLRARELLLIYPAADGSPDNNDGVIALRSGKSGLSDAACLRLLQRLLLERGEGPLVKNDMDSDAEYREFAAVNPCLLVAIGNSQPCVGWLLALGRDVSPSALANAACRVGAASESEFGTVEASLMSTAAVLLATHARNLALLRAKEDFFISIIRCLVNDIGAEDQGRRDESPRSPALAAACALPGVELAGVAAGALN